MSCFYGKEKRAWLGNFQGGMMQHPGCHLIDLVVRLQGIPEDIIPYNYATETDGVSSKDVAFAIMKYPNGLSFVKSSMLASGGYVKRNLVIYGERGKIEICPLEKYEGGLSTLSTKMTEYTPKNGWHGLGKQTESSPFDRYEPMLSAFAAMVREERGYEVELETEARIHRCLLAACGLPCDYKGEMNI